MKFEDIKDSIISASNKYEKEYNIETIKLEIVEGSKEEDWAILKGHKSDKSCTLFFAMKHKRATDDSWRWFCPSKNHIVGLYILNGLYWINEIENKILRLFSYKKPVKEPTSTLVDFTRGGAATD